MSWRVKRALPAWSVGSASGRQRGFTLIELAVVIAVVGLLAAGAVTSFSAIRTNTKIKETRRVMNTAELLLQGFLASENRLPCPAELDSVPSDSDYGLEARSSGVCAGALEVGGTNLFWGAFPAKSVGATVSDMADGWGSRLFYMVNGDAAEDDALTSTDWTEGDSIVLWDDIARDSDAEVITNGVVAIMSSGANANGGYPVTSGTPFDNPPAGADGERENLNLDGDDGGFVTLNYSTDPNDPFDDVVRVFTEDDIVLPLALNGVVSTKRAETLDRIALLAEEIHTSAILNSSLLPTVAAVGSRPDAWGDDIVYNPWPNYTSGSGICSGASPDTFTLSSSNIPGSARTYTLTYFLTLVTAAGLACPF